MQQKRPLIATLSGEKNQTNKIKHCNELSVGSTQIYYWSRWRPEFFFSSFFFLRNDVCYVVQTCRSKADMFKLSFSPCLASGHLSLCSRGWPASMREWTPQGATAPVNTANEAVRPNRRESPAVSCCLLASCAFNRFRVEVFYSLRVA